MKIAKLSIVLSLLLACFYIAISQREVLTFESKGNTKAYKNSMWSYDDPADLVIPKNTSLPVIGCDDIKTDVHIQVKKDGVTYNISDGAYLLKREQVSFVQLITTPRATYSCKGFFINEQKAIIPGNA